MKKVTPAILTVAAFLTIAPAFAGETTMKPDGTVTSGPAETTTPADAPAATQDEGPAPDAVAAPANDENAAPAGDATQNAQQPEDQGGESNTGDAPQNGDGSDE